MELNAMTFNLRVNTPVDGANAWPYRIHRVGALIREADPAVIGTQEGFYTMLRDLDGELPAYSRLGEGRSGYESGNADKDECCAIYYKHELLTPVKHGQFWLSETPDVPDSNSWDSSESRICTWVCFEGGERLGAGRRFYVFNTHFDHLGQRAREESARIVIERITRCREEDGLPVILMGDFNAHPDNPAVVTLREQFTDTYSVYPEPVGRTFHAYEGGTEGEPIDYIFVSPDVRLIETVVHRGQVDGSYPSDHYPIAARVALG